ncbi:antibiotic biosynthesis monooxygenase [Aeromicrobium sp. Root495]|uniref:putative quinol monooxygenase n=1 Tax=Aeromicrobium sp. Root495 TaxID=1736550 RepID=UPI0006F87FDF|nr:putative quinol monooxygenase [Aeromicrobium sp. Root495]KQY59879.1 antibiotic biosynthesis monooxygenase [Aeromicrobium sp. Root495]
MSIHVVAVITAKPGSEDAVREAMQGLVEPTRAEDGCIAYDLSESAAAAGTFITVEEWNDPADLDLHMATPHIQSALSVLGTELAAPPAIHPLKPLIVG